jgi:hypothetical protein
LFGLTNSSHREGLFLMANSYLRLVPPTEVLRTVFPTYRPTRQPNAKLRTREHLTRDESQLIEAAKGNRNGHRTPP